MNSEPKKTKVPRRLMPFLIIAAILIAVVGLMLSQPEPKLRNKKAETKISVETLAINSAKIVPTVLSYGLVEPRTQSSLVAQVSGRVEQISERFRDGAFFREGELLLQIDATDYEIELEVAKANLASAERALAEELGAVEQAKTDWKRTKSTVAAKPLALREPHLKAAQAQVRSAQALVKRAEVNLSRTSVVAPYDGRVLSTSIDLGQVASNNAVLGEVYATDAVEVRLPIKNEDLPLLQLPEDNSYNGTSQSINNGEGTTQTRTKVRIRSELAGEEIWHGHILRTAGSLDEISRQLYLVARIDDPFGEKSKGRFPLKIGQYVTAQIDGIEIASAISIPNKAIYQGSYVYLYRDGAVFRTPVTIRWQNGEIAIIEKGVTAGDELVVSPLGQVVSGTSVRLARDISGSAGEPL